MAELTKEGKKFISEMLDEIMFARRLEELLSGVDVKETDKFIQDESMRLMEKYGKMGRLELIFHTFSLKTESEEEIKKMAQGQRKCTLGLSPQAHLTKTYR